MRKYKYSFFVVMMLTIVGIGLLSCTKDDKNESDPYANELMEKIVGTWIDSKGLHQYVFESSGIVRSTFFLKDAPITSIYKYRIAIEDYNDYADYEVILEDCGYGSGGHYVIEYITDDEVKLSGTVYYREGSNNSGETVDIQNIVNENVSADVLYEYFTFSLELYTYLTDNGKYYAGRSDIKYGVEWSYTNRPGAVYSYILDPKNSFMDVTVVSSNHYSVIIPIFAFDDDEETTVLMNIYSFQYRAVKKKEERGETLTKDERDLKNSVEKQLNKYISEVNAYRGKIFVEIDGKRYYVCSFKK